jgi:TetR/AcrR family transcriptional repressor of lmrAB and yxaGH operons
MAGEQRARMTESAVRLLAQRGLQATSFSEVLELSGAPRGSIYHHFPDGKDQLIGAALELAGGRMHELLGSWAGQSAEQLTASFLAVWRTILTRSEFGAGCAVAAVTIAADSPALLDQTAEIFRSWRAQLAGLLEQGGLEPGHAARFSATLVASSEGAVIMSRAEQSIEPFELVAAQLLEQVATL